MSIEMLQKALGWCAIINMGILLWWFLFWTFARGWVYKMHHKWCPVSEERFNEIHYIGMMFFKLAIFFFNVIPYFALKIQ